MENHGKPQVSCWEHDLLERRWVFRSFFVCLEEGKGTFIGDNE